MGLNFSLYGNELGPEGGKAIAKALETNKTVQTIKYAPCSAEEFGEVGGLAFVRDGNTILRPAREKKPEQVSQSAKL